MAMPIDGLVASVTIQIEKGTLMIETPQITQSAAQITAIIRLNIPRNEIQQVMGPAMGELMATLSAQGIAPAGPLFSHHLRMDPDMFDLEVSVPVSVPVTAAGRVQPSHMPAVKVARTVYRGPYEKLSDGWSELMDWVKENGHAPGHDLWECYVSGPEADPDPANWRTELNRPIID